LNLESGIWNLDFGFAFEPAPRRTSFRRSAQRRRNRHGLIIVSPFYFAYLALTDARNWAMISSATSGNARPGRAVPAGCPGGRRPREPIGFQGGKRMTFEECHTELLAIRRRQRTRCPMVQIDYGGSIYQGRVTRSDSDPEHRHSPQSPYGIIVLENPGLSRAPQTILQIADIAQGAICDWNHN
jgi:hypothetical protein